MVSLPPSQYRLYHSRDNYFVCTEAANDDKPLTLSISRKTNEISLLAGNLPTTQGSTRSSIIYAIFGIATLINSDYMIVVTEREKVARIFSTDIYRATDFALYPIDATHGAESLMGTKSPEEAYLLDLLKTHLFSAPFYFACGDYDLTSRLQAQKETQKTSLWEQADDRFFWNKFLLSRLIEITTRNVHNLNRFIVPFIFGFCEFRQTSINSNQFLFGLISRRSRYRAGTRYFSRGIDTNGNVSNYNETEMLCVIPKANGDGGIRTSYVQTRGSVPVYWTEISNLRYKPDLKIMDLANTIESAGKHFDQQVEIYGDVYAINLVNQKGYEKAVKDAYERAVEQLANPRVHYTYFDFHHECRKFRFDRVSVLLNALEEEIHNQGYFMQDANSSNPMHKQSSVMRSNCMDCLDRTNVVQSALAQFVLIEQLRRLSILGPKETLNNHPDFLLVFRNIWADNANAVSNAYSGSGALKTDYTRTGIRTKQGALMDGYNSLLRYFKNNFYDGPRQDAYDLVTGAWTYRKSPVSYLQDHRPIQTRVAPALLLGIMIVFAVSYVSPDLSQLIFGSSVIFFVYLVLTFVAVSAYILSHGIDYVAWPRLNSLQDVISYEGRGHESGRRGRGPSTWYGRRMDPTLHMDRSSGVSGMADTGRETSVKGVGAPLDSGSRMTASMQQMDWKKMSISDGDTKRRKD